LCNSLPFPSNLNPNQLLQTVLAEDAAIIPFNSPLAMCELEILFPRYPMNYAAASSAVMMIPLLVNIMDHGPAARSPHILPLSTPRSEVSPRQTIHLQLGRQNSWFMGITAALEPDVKHPPFIFFFSGGSRVL
jgi:hypothetical protein